MRICRAISLTSLALVLLLGCATSPRLEAQSATKPASQPAAQPAAKPTAQPAVATPSPWSGASKSAALVIAKANDLVKAGKWQSAWAALDAADAKNADPYLLALKTDICLRGYVRTELHQSFALVDLAKDQTLESVRADENEYPTFAFDPVASAAALEGSGTVLPAVLAGALGDYYYEVQNLFSGAWVLSDEEACDAGIVRYEAAATGGVASAEQLRRRGELLLRFSRLEDAENVIKQSLVLDPAAADTHFIYALVYGQSGKMPEAFGELDKAIAGYADAEKRFNALLFGARVAASSDAARSEGYLKAAEAAFPEEPGPALVRHVIAIQNGDPAAAVAAADAAEDRFPESPYVVRSLLSSWLDAQDIEGAFAWLDHAMGRMTGKDASIGVLAFYKAIIVAQTAVDSEGIAEANALLDTAEASFRKVYKSDNEAFSAISDLRTQFAMAAASAEASALDAGIEEGAEATEGADATSGASSSGN